MTTVVGVGAGGHAKVMIEILRLMGTYDIMGVLDVDPTLHGQTVSGVPVLGDDSLLAELYSRGVHHAFIGLGTVGTTGPRKRLYDIVRSQGFTVLSAIHPHAVVSKSAELGLGATVLAGAIINPGARLGDNVIVNSGAIVEHDCVVEDHVHIATGAKLAGSVHVGEGTHIGLSASILQDIRVGSHAVIGAGAVVVREVPPGVLVTGVPAQILRSVEQ